MLSIGVTRLDAWSEQDLQRAKAMMPTARLAVLGQRRPEQQAQSIIATVLAMALLGGAGQNEEAPGLWLPTEALRTARLATPQFPGWQVSPKGKPFPDGIDWNGENRFFSLSHTKLWVAAAVADEPIGLDIQEDAGVSPEHRQRIVKHCHTSVQQLYAAAEEADRPDRFYRLWTVAESVGKLLGCGLSLPLRELELMPLEPGVWRAVLHGQEFHCQTRFWQGAWVTTAQLFTKKTVDKFRRNSRSIP